MTTPMRDSATPAVRRARKKHFTLDEANRALAYVSRVMEDVRRTYRRAVMIQQHLEEPRPSKDHEAVRDEYDRLVEQLNGYVDELKTVGVELKDYDRGLVDFPAMHEGREVCLCWKRGEKTITAWHEVDAGYAGRQDIRSLAAKPE